MTQSKGFESNSQKKKRNVRQAFGPTFPGNIKKRLPKLDEQFLDLLLFPTELLQNVLGWLDLVEVLKCRSVCQRWKDVIDDSAFQRRLHVQTFDAERELSLEESSVCVRRDYELAKEKCGLPIVRAVESPRTEDEWKYRLVGALDLGFSRLVDRCLREAEALGANKTNILETWTTTVRAGEKEFLSTPLFLTSLGGGPKVARVLLSHGAKPDNVSTNSGSGSVYAAAFSGNVEVLKLLIEARANINAIRPIDGSTPFWIAVRKGHVEAAKMLLEAGAILTVNKPDRIDATYAAVKMGYVEMMPMLLKNLKVDLNGLVVGGSTLLYVAAYEKKLEMVRYLLDQGADPNVRNEDGTNSTYIAAYHGDLEMMNLLLERGADPNLCRHDDMSPLAVAMQERKEEMVRLLLKSGKMDLSILRSDGANFFYIAARSGSMSIFRATLEAFEREGRPIDVNVGRNDGVTALNAVAQNGHFDVAKALLDLGADPNRVSVNGVSPLLIAAQENRLKVVRLLIQFGADLRHNVEGATALFIAAQQGHREVVVELIKAGADVHAARNNGVTVCQVAKAKNHTEIVQTLERAGANLVHKRTLASSELSDALNRLHKKKK
jgi:ankyrin repeat protein